MPKGKRALVTLPDGVWEIIDTGLKGRLGDGDSEVIRNIVISYLTEKGYFTAAKTRATTKDERFEESMRQFRSVLELYEAMLIALAEMLGQKKIITVAEWKKRVDKIQKDLKNVK